MYPFISSVYAGLEVHIQQDHIHLFLLNGGYEVTWILQSINFFELTLKKHFESSKYTLVIINYEYPSFHEE